MGKNVLLLCLLDHLFSVTEISNIQPIAMSATGLGVMGVFVS